MLVVTEDLLQVLLEHGLDAGVHRAPLGQVVGVRGARRPDDRLLLGLDRAGEDPIEGVVIGRGNGIELVVVAARAGDRQPQKSLRRDVNPVVDDVGLIAVEVVAEGDESEGRQRRRGLAASQPVGGQLFPDELVVRHVVVERLDDVVAVGPGERVERTLPAPIVLSLAVGIAGNVEPVPPPPLAIAAARPAGRRRSSRTRSASRLTGRPALARASAAGR